MNDPAERGRERGDATASSLPALQERNILLNPETGEILPATAENAAVVLQALRRTEDRIKDAKRYCTDILVMESKRQGTKTMHMPDGSIATIHGGSEVVWDVEKLQDALVEAGLPEDRLEDLISTTVEFKINNSVARQLAAANPAYAEAIEAAKQRVPAPERASVRGKEHR